MGITREISEEAAKRLGPIADKHKIWIGFHNHTQLTPTLYDGPILSYGNYLGINLDIGHYVAGTNASPLPLIEKHQDRIVSLHLKDRKVNDGPNMPFGQGDTPVALVLNLMKRRRWTFPGRARGRSSSHQAGCWSSDESHPRFKTMTSPNKP